MGHLSTIGSAWNLFVGKGASVPTVRPVTQAELLQVLGPPPVKASHHVYSDVWDQPYRGPLDFDRYGDEAPEMRNEYRTQYREVPVLRAAVRGKADDISFLEPTVLAADKDDAKSAEAAEFVNWSVSQTPRGWRGVVDSIYTPALIDGFSLCEPKSDVKRWRGRNVWSLASVRSLDSVFLRLQLDQYRNVIAVVNLIRGIQ